jgi:hypothetical protein
VLQINGGREQCQVFPADFADQASLALGVVKECAAGQGDLKGSRWIPCVKVSACSLYEAKVTRQLRAAECI